MNIVRSLMKLDYLAHHRFQPRKLWWDETIATDELTSIEHTLLATPNILGNAFSSLPLNARNFRKQTQITSISVDPDDLEVGITERKGGHLLTVFQQDDKPLFFFLEQSFAN